MRRRHFAGLIAIVALGAILTGCGQPAQKTVISQLQQVQTSLSSYRASALMTVALGSRVEKYYVETWFKAPDLYRIALANEAHEVSQIILHNGRNVFLISPGTKRVIRFQGNWAARQGQMYLYHALIARLLSESEPTFRLRDGIFTFTLPGDPGNPLIRTERVQLADKTFAPVKLELFDRKDHAVITLTWTGFATGVVFAPGAFSPEQTTSLQPIEVPVSASVRVASPVEPDWLPADDELSGRVQRGGTTFIRYAGPLPFIVVETRARAGGQGLSAGQLVLLYGLPAVLTHVGPVVSVFWDADGSAFEVMGHLSTADVLRVAESMVAASAP